jgi:aldehyde:ferredoxin oxidoreductase
MLVGKLAKIDLDTGRIDLDPIAGATLCDYLGGRGLNMRLLFPWLKKPGDPFYFYHRQEQPAEVFRNVSKWEI